MLSEIVNEHAASVGSGRTRIEVKGALRNFVATIADLPLDELTRDHVRRFCAAEGAKDIGGKIVKFVWTLMN